MCFHRRGLVQRCCDNPLDVRTILSNINRCVLQCARPKKNQNFHSLTKKNLGTSERKRIIDQSAGKKFVEGFKKPMREKTNMPR